MPFVFWDSCQHLVILVIELCDSGFTFLLFLDRLIIHLKLYIRASLCGGLPSLMSGSAPAYNYVIDLMLMNRTSRVPKSVLRYVLDKSQYFNLESVFTQSCFPTIQSLQRYLNMIYISKGSWCLCNALLRKK